MITFHVGTAATWRGGEQQILYLLRGLTAAGVQAHLATPPGSPLASRARDLGIPTVPLVARGDLDLVAARRLRRLARGADLLHLHTGRAHGVGRLAFAAGPRPGILVSRRVDFPIRGGPAGAWKYRRGVDRYLTVSEAVGRVLVAGGVAPERVVTVHSGVDATRFEGPREGAWLREELGIPMDAKLVGFVGALVPHKAPLDLLRALEALPTGIHGVLAGTGELEGRLREVARVPALAGRVHLLGYREDIPRLLRALDVFCLPSRLEGLGTSVLDAMAAGTPVVVADGGGLTEMVENGQNGLVVPAGRPEALAGALRQLLLDPVLAGRLAAAGRTRVTRFSAQRMVDRTRSVYEAVLRERGSARGR